MKKFKLNIIFFIFISLIFLIIPTEALSWSIPQAIVSENFQGSSIAIDTSGNFHVVYRTYSGNWGESSFISNIKYSNGSTSQTISSASYSSGYALYSPEIAIDSNGKLHVIYSMGTVSSGNLVIMYTNNVSGVWSTPQTIVSENFQGSSIAIDTSGNFHVVYRTYSGNYGESSFISNIKYSNTSTSQTISSATYNSGYALYSPDVAIDSNGKLHVIYRRDTISSGNSVVMYTSNTSGAWSIPQAIVSENFQGSSIAIDTSGNFHVVYRTYSGNYGESSFISNIKYSNTSTSQTISSATYNSGYALYSPDVAIDSNGKLHVIYRRDTISSGDNVLLYTNEIDNPIPTLNEWGIIILIIFMITVGMLKVKKRRY